MQLETNKMYSLVLFYAAILILGYGGLSNKDFLLLCFFILLSGVTIFQVNTPFVKVDEGDIHMHIILFYLNFACLISFFFWLFTKLYVGVYVPEVAIIWRNITLVCVNLVLFMSVRSSQKAKLVSLEHPAIHKCTRRYVNILEKRVWAIQLLKNDYMYMCFEEWTKFTILVVCLHCISVLFTKAAPWWLTALMLIFGSFWMCSVITLCIQGYYLINLMGNKIRTRRIKYEGRK